MNNTSTETLIAKPAARPRRGIIFALAIIPVGIIAWVVLWQFGFIASVVAWGVAAGAIWLYKLGASQDVTKAVAPYIIAIIVLTVILAFLGGMASDAWMSYTSKDIGGTGDIVSSDFVSFFVDNLMHPELWQSYTTDILISAAFIALGAGSTVYNLYMKNTKKQHES